MASGDSIGIFTPDANVPMAAGTLMTFVMRNGHLLLEATAAAQDGCAFASVMPQNYGGATGITADVTWCAKTANAGTGGWDITFERNSGTSGDDITSDHWQTAQTIAAITVPGTAGILTISSVAIAAGAAGTASIVAGDAYRVRVRRLNSDSAVGPLQLLALHLKET